MADHEIFSMGATFTELKDLIQKVNIALKQRSAPDQVSYKVNVTIEEILTNSIKYAFSSDGRVHEIIVSLRFREHEIDIIFEDDGNEFDPSSVNTSANLGKAIQEIEPGGLGLLLVKKMVKDMRYERRGHRNLLSVTISK